MIFIAKIAILRLPQTDLKLAKAIFEQKTKLKYQHSCLAETDPRQ
jgi:hypothetical protein